MRFYFGVLNGCPAFGSFGENAMPLILNNCTFNKCAGGVSAPSDTLIISNDTNFLNMGQAFNLYEPGTLQSIGLPASTPHDQLEELIAELRKHRAATEAEKTAIVAKSRLGGFLSGFGSITTIAKNLIDIVSKLP
jgi:hypothetical protein